MLIPTQEGIPPGTRRPAEFTDEENLNIVGIYGMYPALPGLASSLAALISVHQDHSGNSHQSGCDKTKWLNLVPEPVENEYVAKPHGYRRQNDNEK